ncbi:hypothetical protein [Pedobacter sp. MR2016-24]|uniref:hypothetical protein n=1 Tax=Pedobacter sp. MR2016-24 TaxID=2994466 RepID=UPI0022483367|nr:hypothetical protein [Pedobacter sp. MR2016-24]MCX2483394.1 hypothetical protein [Pedobacter sp. MR2016-24]
MAEWTSYENKAWYVYNGIGDPYHPTSYRRVNSKPKCEQGKRICAIYTGSGDIFPDSPLSGNITQYIAEAMVTNSTQPPCIKKRTKIFVYLKD